MSKTAIVVDGAYAIYTVYSIDPRYRADFRKIRRTTEKILSTTVVDSLYLNSITEDYNSNEPLKIFHEFLRKPYANGGAGMKTKLYGLKKRLRYWPDGTPVLHPITGVQFEDTKQRGVDVGIAFHTIASFIANDWNKLILFAGDSDFRDVVEHLVNVEGVRVLVVGTHDSISPELLEFATPWYLEDLGENFVSPRTV